MAEKEDIEKDIEKILSKEHIIYPEEIKAFREKLGLNQTQFAEKLGRHLSTISYWESGEKSPSKKSIRKIKKLAEEEGIKLSLSKGDAQAGKIPESEVKT